MKITQKEAEKCMSKLKMLRAKHNTHFQSFNRFWFMRADFFFLNKRKRNILSLLLFEKRINNIMIYPILLIFKIIIIITYLI